MNEKRLAPLFGLNVDPEVPRRKEAFWRARLANPDPAIEVLIWDEGQGPVCDWTTGQCDAPEEG